MKPQPGRTARIPTVSGRFVFLLLALVVACRPVPATDDAPTPPVEVEPLVSEEPISPARQARAAELFRLARDERAAGRPAEAVALADRIVEEFPSSSVSGRALRLVAEAALEAGQWAVADEAAQRYAALLPPEDPRRVEMYLLQARAMEGLEDIPARVERLLRIDYGAPAELRAEAAGATRTAVRGLSPAEAADLLDGAPTDAAVRPVLQAWYARLLVAEGRPDDAARQARQALEAGLSGPDSVLAATVLDPTSGELPEIPGLRTARLGSVLPLSGSPALREAASLIAEGVEVATATAQPQGLQVELLAFDDAGDPGLADSLVMELEEEGALGSVGFLRDEALAAASSARRGELPLVSPTAHAGPDTPDGVLTLAGADPVAAASVAEYAAGQGYRRAAVIHSRLPESVEEARAIERTLQERGVPVVGTFPYAAGATFFQDQIRGAREVLRMEEIRALNLGEDDTLRVEELDPVALFVPIPAEDVEFVAPQLTFFGLDTLGIDILGTSGWTDPATFEAVDDRHTTGVVATAPLNAGPGSSGYERFRDAYEAHFQRTLVSPVPALGYDAALLLLEAIGSGAVSPAQVRAALGRIRDLEGATGTFSVVDGRVLRRQEVVRIVNGGTIPVR